MPIAILVCWEKLLARREMGGVVCGVGRSSNMSGAGKNSSVMMFQPGRREAKLCKRRNVKVKGRQQRRAPLRKLLLQTRRKLRTKPLAKKIQKKGIIFSVDMCKYSDSLILKLDVSSMRLKV